MRRHDLLTYDIDQRPRAARLGVSPRLAVLLIVVVALAVVLVIWTAHSAGPSPRSAPPGHVRSTIAASHRWPKSATPRATASPAIVGSDAGTSDRPPDGSKAAAARFVAAWLQRAPKPRKAALHDTAAPGLAEELMLTSTANIPKARPKGAPVPKHASAYSVQFAQRLSNGMRIRIYLVADPGTRYGWTVTSVERA